MYQIDELILKNRSFRAFDRSVPITSEIMQELVDLARRCPSAINRQPLRYRILHAEEDCAKILSNARFARGLANTLGITLPPVGGEPTGYIAIFEDSEAESPHDLMLKDVGIAAQSILLAATARGFGGCMLGSFDPVKLNADFGISARYIPHLVIALGKPAETVCLVEAENGALGYYRDAQNTHCVPKLPLSELFI